MFAAGLTIGVEGAQLFKAALSSMQVGSLQCALAAPARHQAGIRLSGIPELSQILSPEGPVGRIRLQF